MELKTILSKTEEELQDPEQALRAWTNGCRTIDEIGLSDTEKRAKHQENNDQLQAILVTRLVSYSWSARAFYNVIEDHYPRMCQDEGQLQTRKTLMKILQGAMDAVECKRVEERKGIALI